LEDLVAVPMLGSGGFAKVSVMKISNPWRNEMSQKLMIALAVCLTAFVLVMAGGVFARVSGASAAPDPVAALSPAVQDLWNQRETAYRALVDQANQRLEAVGQTQTADSAQATAGQAVSAGVSPSEAALLALTAAPGAGITRQPELVLFQGITAYEVQTTQGPVYIDAATGQVVYNSAAQITVAAAHEDWDDDHESDDD
jgi:hypothetical protein